VREIDIAGGIKTNGAGVAPIRSAALEEILARGVYYKSFELKQKLFMAGLKPQRCEECGWAQRTPEGHLPLEIHHVNGDRYVR
jgi:hypothetical protein